MDTKNSRILAYLDDFNLVSVYLSKYYYDGKSSCFMLKDNDTGRMETVEIINSYESRNHDYTVYKLKINEIEFGKEYDIFESNGLSCSLAYGRIVQSGRFDTMFAHDEPLGAIYDKEKTLFRVWSPTSTRVKLDYCLKNETFTVDMKRGAKGIFECSVDKDMDGAVYCFLVKDGRSWKQVQDPYAVSSTSNSKYSVVINLDKIDIDLNKDKLPPLKSINEAILYELSIRDFSSMKESGVVNQGKYLGMVERNTKTPNGIATGLDYLVDLGITHVQIMPMFDFATVDEDNPWAYYNWGYDPAHYNVPEGSYATNPRDGYSRVKEVKEMVSKLHESGIRVVMDVVFNHMYDRATALYENLVPNYFFRVGPNNEISNGTYCGNDVASEKPMVRKIIVDTCLHWIKTYGIDGFRFDLMGILDIETMLIVEEKCKEVDPNFILYGEGWNMPTFLEQEKRSTIANQDKLSNIAFFNDHFRDIIKGSTSEFSLSDQGYGAGNTYEASEAILALKSEGYLNVSQSINYLECHDNATLFDKLKVSNHDETAFELESRINLMNAMVLLSQGIPFLHAGQEFCATKFGEHNTYNKPDAINQINWLRRDHYIGQVNYVKALIKLRKQLGIFSLNNKEEMKQILNIDLVDYRMIVMNYHDIEKIYSGYEEIKVYINPTKNHYRPHSLMGNWVVIFDKYGIVDERKINNDTFVEEISILVLAKKYD